MHSGPATAERSASATPAPRAIEALLPATYERLDPLLAAGMSLVARLDDITARFADCPAISGTQWRLTYRELDSLANHCAASIVEELGTDSEPVSLVFDQADDLAVVFQIAVLKSGKFFTMLDPEMPDATLRTVQANVGSRLIVCGAACAAKTQALSTSARIVGAQQIAAAAGAAPKPLPMTIAPNAIACIVHTSGSTGDPQGVVLSHRSLMQLVAQQINVMRLGPRDRISQLCRLPTVASLSEIYSSLLSGASLHRFALAAQGSERLARWINDQQISVFTAVPAVFRVLTSGLAPGERLSTLRMIRLSGDRILKADIEGFRAHCRDDCLVRIALGAAEAMLYAHMLIDRTFEVRQALVPAGFPLDGFSVRILDENGRPVATGEIGEIAVSSPWLAEGYWNNPALTAERFVHLPDTGHRSYLTRDLGYFDADGCLYHVGRKNDCVKINGAFVSLVRLEEALLEMPGIREAAVVPYERGARGTALAGFYVAEHDRDIGLADVQAKFREVLTTGSLPLMWRRLDKLPLTPAFKLDRRELARLAEADPGRPAKRRGRPAAQRSELEITVTTIWQSALEIEDIDVDDNFFDLGGDSLAALRVVSALRTALCREIPVSILVEAPTVASLCARLLSGESPVAFVALGAPSPGAPATTPLFCIYGLYLYHDLATALAGDVPSYGVYVPEETEHRGAATALPVESLAARYLQQIRSIQPTGPYRMIGGCFGAVVAFEIAQQLKAQGETVQFLGLIEPFMRRSMTATSLRSWSRRIRRMLRGLAAWSPTIERALFDQNAIADWARRRATAAYDPRPFTGDAVLIRAEKGLEFPGYEVDQNYGWSAIIQGKLSVHMLPGYHLQLLAKPYVGALAATIKPYLNPT